MGAVVFLTPLLVHLVGDYRTGVAVWLGGGFCVLLSRPRAAKHDRGVGRRPFDCLVMRVISYSEDARFHRGPVPYVLYVYTCYKRGRKCHEQEQLRVVKVSVHVTCVLCVLKMWSVGFQAGALCPVP